MKKILSPEMKQKLAIILKSKQKNEKNGGFGVPPTPNLAPPPPASGLKLPKIDVPPDVYADFSPKFSNLRKKIKKF